MAGIKISQLQDGGNITSADTFPIARGSVQTYKIAANRIVTDGQNIGSGVGMFAGRTVSGSSILQFRTLSGTDENLSFNIVGNTLVFNTSAQNPLKFRFFGDGSTSSFTVGGNLSKNVNNYRVDIDGVLQEPSTDYTIAGTNLLFTTPPPLSSKIVIVTNNLLKTVDALPPPETITYNMLASSTVAQLTSVSAQLFGTSSWSFISTNFNFAVSDRVAVITTSGPLTGTLPLTPAQGNMVTFIDACNSWETNNLTIKGNGATIQNTTDDLICDVSGQKVIMVYTGTTWCVAV